MNKRNTSGFKGVSFDKSRSKYRARMGQKYVGEYDTAEEAARAIQGNNLLEAMSRSDLIKLVNAREASIDWLAKELEGRRMVEMHRI